MTLPNGVQSAEERARDFALEDFADYEYAYRHGKADFMRYAYERRLENIKANDDNASLRLTNQSLKETVERLEAEVERMKVRHAETIQRLRTDCLHACDEHAAGHFGNKQAEIEQRHERAIAEKIKSIFRELSSREQKGER